MSNLVSFKCIKQNYNGEGIILYNNKEYNVRGILKGEEALFEIDKKNEKNPLKLMEITKKSENRIEPFCKFSLDCGGCQYQHMTYETEVDLKQQYLNHEFEHFTDFEMHPILAMHNPYFYRNKCQMTYKLSKSKKVVCGFYEEGTHKIVPVTDCKIQAEKGSSIINIFNKVLSKNKIKPYDERTREGIVRHVVVRYGFNSKEIMLVIITNGEFFPGRKNVVHDLLKENLGITTIVQNFNSRETSIVLGSKERVLYGPGFIYDSIGDVKFKISSKSFFQVNPLGMAVLYKKALEYANIQKNDIVLDTYCGVGTIGILASSKAKKVYGVELNKDAYNDAKVNAKINSIDNIEFINEDSTKFMSHIANENRIDVLIMDPPRDGSSMEFIENAGKLGPKKIIYVSCNPDTLVRDLYQISKNGYKLKHVQGVDMFPRTFNLETIAILEKRN